MITFENSDEIMFFLMQTIYTIHISLNNALALSLPPVLPYTSFNWILNKSFDFAKGHIENITTLFFMGVGANLSFLKSLYFSPLKNFQLHYIQYMCMICNMGDNVLLIVKESLIVLNVQTGGDI